MRKRNFTRLTAWMRRRRSKSGTAAIEFALLIPFLTAMVLATMELGFAMYETMLVYNSVEAGAIYASKKGFSASGISAAVVNATGKAGLTANPAPIQFCGCVQSGVLVTVACTTPACPDAAAPGQYVRISAALPHQTFLPAFALPIPATLSAQTVVRLN